jgi:hypothetical protein
MIRTLLLAAVLAFQGTSVKHTTIAQGDNSGIETSRTVVIRSTADWAALWREHAGEGKPPAVDFNKTMAVAIFAGSRPTAGHAVEIESIDAKGTTLFVRYRVRGPRPQDMVAQVLTAPFLIVGTDAFAGSVSFVDIR